MLFSWTVGPVYDCTYRKAIRSFDDYKGVKVWSIGAVSGYAREAVGMVPVGLGVPEVFTGYEKGVIDAVGMAHLLAYDNGAWKITKYITVQPWGMGNWPVVMNLNKYNSLPADVKKALDEVSGEYAVNFFDKAFNDGVAGIKKEYPNIEFIYLSQADKDKIAGLNKGQADAWKKVVMSQGYSKDTVDRVYDEFSKLEAKYCQ